MHLPVEIRDLPTQEVDPLVGATAPATRWLSPCSRSRSTSATTRAYPSATWSRIAHNTAALQGLQHLRPMLEPSPGAGQFPGHPCQTVITKSAPTNTLIFPKAMSSRVYARTGRMTS